MTDLPILLIRVADEPDDDADHLEQMVRDMLLDIDDLDVEEAHALEPYEVLDGAKGIGVISGWLAVKLASLGKLRPLVEALRDFAGRAGRMVEVTVDGETLKVTGVTTAQQERLIEAWLQRHQPSSP